MYGVDITPIVKPAPTPTPSVVSMHYNLAHWWNGWLHQHPGVFFTTLMVILTALATLALAVNAKKQIHVNEADSLRRYEQTQHQINLQYRNSFYEEVLLYLEDSIYALQDVATALGFPFKDTTQSIPSGRKTVLTPLSERLLPTRLQLHATDEIHDITLKWIIRYGQEEERLNALNREKSANATVDFKDEEHQEARSKFQDSLNWLEEELTPIMSLMKAELHPTFETINPKGKKRAFIFRKKDHKH